MDMEIASRPVAEALLREERTRFTHLISIYCTGEVPCRGFDAFEGEKLACEFDDVTEDMPRFGYKAPTRADVERIVQFGLKIPEVAGVLVHCAAGISRSTAVAYVLRCLDLGPGQEAQAILGVYDLRPEAVPNPRIVQLADDIMGRDGEMIKARISFAKVASMYPSMR